jgi:hypothetical protein
MARIASGLSIDVIGFGKEMYTTPEEVLAYLPKGFTLQDVRQADIDAATEEIESKTGMCYAKRLYEEIIDGEDFEQIFLNHFPISQLFSVAIDDVLITLTELIVKKPTGIIYTKNGVFPDGISNVKVFYIAGYDAVPAIVRKLASLIVAKTMLTTSNGTLDSVRIGDYSISQSGKQLNAELDSAWKALNRKINMRTV